MDSKVLNNTTTKAIICPQCICASSLMGKTAAPSPAELEDHVGHSLCLQVLSEGCTNEHFNYGSSLCQHILTLRHSWHMAPCTPKTWANVYAFLFLN